MFEFVPGQRWISDSELQMGLGTVLTSDHRSVTIVFLATGETRVYAKETAPLTRVQFDSGERIRSHEGWWLTVESAEETNGLMTYYGVDEHGKTAQLEEGQLDNFMQLNRPTDRLFTGQIDHDKWFELRYQTLQHMNRLAHSDLYGIIGVRTSLIPHQLYIAHEVANRYSPRVLLADEVGLGKTIEAGLILHQQLLTERANRVLIIVPETLVHQWLVEMLRRFNLHFSIFDEERCLADEESALQENPFHNEQLILCSLDFIVAQPKRFQQALNGQWDLLVVDEAHHLQWTPEQASVEYNIVEQLAARTKGVLLLTATPEQLGKAGHFARLRLLDPDRFPDLDSFVNEEHTYEPIAAAVEELMLEQTLSQTAVKTLATTIDEGDNQQLLDVLKNKSSSADDVSAARMQLVEHLLDRHGTGRVLFRNTRSAIKGFPQRQICAYALETPPGYKQMLEDLQNTGVSDPKLLLSPERLYQQQSGNNNANWETIDPRVEWLQKTLKALKPKKVLVIAAHAQTVLDLTETLRTKAGIHAAVFHEGLSIIERDRAAAYFADPEYGTQVLLCSEIGSEGRNFQFAHHMILFDLPLNPDLLEQRIGRLDRIGQSETIQIHVPYLANSAQELMFHWYQEGLSAFEHTCPAGHNVFVQVQDALIEALHHIDTGLEDMSELIDTTKQLHHQLNQEMQRGRDRLLEYNSCRPHIANELKIRAASHDAESLIADYMPNAFDCFGIDLEDDTENSYIIRPSERLQNVAIPGLKEDGMTITYDRDTALANEDIAYLTWEHPLVSGAMDAVLSNESGNSAVSAIKTADLKPGTLLLEIIYVLESSGATALQSKRYLPPTTIRIVVDQNGRDYAHKLSHETISASRISVNAATSKKIVRSQVPTLRNMIQAGEALANKQIPQLLSAAHEKSHQMLSSEIHRLQALRQVNPNVREEEIDFLQNQLTALDQAINATTPRLDALRVIVST